MPQGQLNLIETGVPQVRQPGKRAPRIMGSHFHANGGGVLAHNLVDRVRGERTLVDLAGLVDPPEKGATP